MVDIGDKPATQRSATARACVRMQPETLRLIIDGAVPKGDVFAVARLAGIMAAKRTSDLIPLCHPLAISAVSIEVVPDGDTTVRIEAMVRTTGPTGVEMEALTATSVAALTLYDMCKAVDRSIRIDALRLIAKSGGASGDFAQD